MEWVKDIILICVDWILGLFTLPIAKDAEAREKCLHSLYELKRLLRELSKYSSYPSKTDNGYYERLIKIRFVIETLDVKKTGLAFPCHKLNNLIAKSLGIFNKLDPDHSNPAFHPKNSVVALIHTWDDDLYHPTFEKISEIQKSISKSLFGRFYAWIYSTNSTVQQ